MTLTVDLIDDWGGVLSLTGSCAKKKLPTAKSMSVMRNKAIGARRRKSPMRCGVLLDGGCCIWG
jgi:hypothetical protein